VYAIENEIKELQRQIDALAKRVLELTQRIEKADEHAHEEALARMAQGLELKFVGGIVETLERYAQRLNEVYYHVFPDRFDRDVKFERQLHKLVYPPKDEDSTKKS
jgi:hypothetical protein